MEIDSTTEKLKSCAGVICEMAADAIKTEKEMKAPENVPATVGVSKGSGIFTEETVRKYEEEER